MYAIYVNIYHQYTPVMLAYIAAPWILWVWYGFCENGGFPAEMDHMDQSDRSKQIFTTWSARMVPIYVVKI